MLEPQAEKLIAKRIHFLLILTIDEYTEKVPECAADSKTGSTIAINRSGFSTAFSVGETSTHVSRCFASAHTEKQ